MALVKDVQVCQKNQFEDMMYEIEKLERGTNSFVEFAVGTEQESYGFELYFSEEYVMDVREQHRNF